MLQRNRRDTRANTGGVTGGTAVDIDQVQLTGNFFVAQRDGGPTAAPAGMASFSKHKAFEAATDERWGEDPVGTSLKRGHMNSKSLTFDITGSLSHGTSFYNGYSEPVEIGAAALVSVDQTIPVGGIDHIQLVTEKGLLRSMMVPTKGHASEIPTNNTSPQKKDTTYVSGRRNEDQSELVSQIEIGGHDHLRSDNHRLKAEHERFKPKWEQNVDNTRRAGHWERTHDRVIAFNPNLDGSMWVRSRIGKKHRQEGQYMTGGTDLWPGCVANDCHLSWVEGGGLCAEDPSMEYGNFDHGKRTGAYRRTAREQPASRAKKPVEGRSEGHKRKSTLAANIFGKGGEKEPPRFRAEELVASRVSTRPFGTTAGIGTGQGSFINLSAAQGGMRGVMGEFEQTHRHLGSLRDEERERRKLRKAHGHAEHWHRDEFGVEYMSSAGGSASSAFSSLAAGRASVWRAPIGRGGGEDLGPRAVFDGREGDKKLHVGKAMIRHDLLRSSIVLG